MLHYTLNTGHTRQSPREEVSREVIEIVRPLLRAGDHDLPIEGYRCVVTPGEFDSPGDTGLLATVWRRKVPLVTIGVAPDDAAAELIWPQLESLYLKISELPGIRSADFALSRRPETTPWCAAVTIHAERSEPYWLGDFERCLAWAWIERKGSEG